MKTVFRIIIIVLTVFWVSGRAFAQQDPMYTKFMFNKLVINPAYAGSADLLRIGLHYRTQWVGFEGAPNTATVHAHTPIFNESGGLGFSLVHDEVGITSTTSMAMQLAYRVKFSDSWRLSFGMTGEVMMHNIDWANANPLDVDDQNIPFNSESLFLPNIGAGVYLDSDRFFAGISMPRFLENALDYTDGAAVQIQTQAAQSQHVFGMAGLVLGLGPEVELIPQVLAKYQENSPFQMDYNVMAVLDQLVWVGATYRTNDSFDAIVGLQLSEKFRFSYSYDFTISQLQRFNDGSHEIMLMFNVPKRSKGIYHPRYF